ncbi:uncharacterized protein P884DRAFT_262872 [Thermothelomyces heterothallicus CBS 202.75]|uniref:uncharacterized protein n=1 Tax=Thermothelomyces heterothallicus CBS 202.75 TaxID=1149848 RepID=UPI003743D440
MVTTRRSAQQPLSEEDGISSDASSIPAETPPRRRPSTIGVPSTLRPSREPAASNTSPTKRKHRPGATTEGPQLKRQRSPFDVRDTIEIQGEDDDVDAAIKATSLRPASRIEVRLPGGRLSREGNRTFSVGVPSDGSIADITGPRRLRARRLKRQVQSVEVFGVIDSSHPRRKKRGDVLPTVIREEHEPDSDSSRVQRGHAAKMVQEGVLSGAAPRGSGGSRGLQPSSPTKPPADIYDIPSDGDSDQPNPAPARASRTINNRQTQRRRKPTGTSPRRPHSPIRDIMLSSIREEKQSQSATVTASRHEAHRTASGRGSNAGPPRLGEEVQDSEDKIGPEGGGSTGRDAEGSVDTGAIEESDGSESDEATRGPSLEGIQVRPYRDNEPTILAYSEHLSNMLELMGRPGWTEAGRRWMKLCSTMPDSDEDSPARSRLGRRILNDLGRLNDELDDIPNALDLGQQSQALASRQQALNGAISSVDKTVRKIERRAGPASDGQGSQSGSRLSRRLADDLTKCVVPMLVLVLRTAFAIGVDEPDAEATDSTPRRGVFTWTTVQYLMVILAWLSRLRRQISGNTSPAAEGSETSSAQKRADPDDAKQNRERFGVIVRKWIQQLRHEVDTYNQQADLRLARHQMRERDRKIREQRQREEEVEMAAARLQEEAFRLSMQQVASKPRPLAEKFYKATAHWGLPPAGSGDNTSGARNPTPSAPRSSSSSMFLTPAPARQQSALPSPVLGDRRWSEWEIDTFL